MPVTELKTEYGFREAIKTLSQLVVVDFFADWCGPCKTLKKSLNDISMTHRDAKFYSINVDHFHGIANEYSISALPTLVFFRRGTEVARVTGADVQKILATLKKHM